MSTAKILAALTALCIIADTVLVIVTGGVPDTLTLTTTTVIGGLLGSTIPGHVTSP